MSGARRIAFLRAINVGGRRVKMPDLKRAFEDAGFKDVETFIASGNVGFTGGGADLRKLERKIERALKSSLGFEVATFVRSISDLDKLTKAKPFPQLKQSENDLVQIGFL